MKANSTTIAIALIVLSIVAHFGVVNPMSDSLMKTRTELTNEELRLNTIELGNNQQDDMRHKIEELTKTNEMTRSTLISPLLNSYAMSVKALVDAMATECGMVNVEYTEGALLALPIPKDCIPTNRTARRTIRIKAMADYAAAVSFIMRAEKELPLMTVQSFTMTAPKDSRFDRQDVEILLEWPGKGEVIK